MTTACDMPIDLSTKSQHHHRHQLLNHEQLLQMQLDYLSHQQLSAALANHPLNRLYAASHHGHLPLLHHNSHQLHISSSSSSSSSSSTSSSNEAASPEVQDGPLDATISTHNHSHELSHHSHHAHHHPDHHHHHPYPHHYPHHYLHHHPHQYPHLHPHHHAHHHHLQHQEPNNQHQRTVELQFAVQDQKQIEILYSHHHFHQHQQAESPPAHQLNQQLSLHQSAVVDGENDNPSPIDLHRSSTSSTVSTISSPSSSSASITSTSSSLNLQLNDKKRINRPLTGKHVKHGTGASVQTLVTLRKVIRQRQQQMSVKGGLTTAGQGLLLFRIRNELHMTVSCYRRLYESAIRFGLNKSFDAKLQQFGPDQDQKPIGEKSNDQIETASAGTADSQAENVARLREYYENELAKKDEIIGQQRAIMRALNLSNDQQQQWQLAKM